MYPPNILLNVMSLIFPLMFLLVFGTILVTLFRSLKEWNKNNHSPRLTVEAAVVAKREEITRRRSANTTHTHRSIWYYVTFQFESGDRMELSVPGHEYGMLVEGDRGRLSFQGTRYLSFERMTLS